MTSVRARGAVEHRETVGVIRQGPRVHHVAACTDGDGLWVEISGPKGGKAWPMAPALARDLAAHLTAAADRAEARDRRQP